MSNCRAVSLLKRPTGWDMGMLTPHVPHTASTMGLSLFQSSLPLVALTLVSLLALGGAGPRAIEDTADVELFPAA